MKHSAPLALALALALATATSAHSQQAISVDQEPTITDLGKVAPALEQYAQAILVADLWQRPGLSPRDRSIVTIAALIARDQAVAMPDQLNLALDNGVQPDKLSEIITHLAFYSGWPNAMVAATVAGEVFARR